MSQEAETKSAEGQVTLKSNNPSSSSSSSSATSSPSNSISLIKLDELSWFGATKQRRLPTLIKLNSEQENKMQSSRLLNSLPAIDMKQLEASSNRQQQQASLPSQVKLMETGGGSEPTTVQSGQQPQQHVANKENQSSSACGDNINSQAPELSDDFQMVDMVAEQDGLLVGPSLPQAQQPLSSGTDLQSDAKNDNDPPTLQRSALASSQQLNNQQQYPSHLGDSLIEMIINLRNENQNLVRALEANNEYVKERINEFKRAQEEARRREAKFALEKADHEHQARKLQRQNKVLSERLKSLEVKLKELKVEAGESLAAAHSSKTSSVRDPTEAVSMQQDCSTSGLYPTLAQESFGDSALNHAATMQVDAGSAELNLNNDSVPPPLAPAAAAAATAPPMDRNDERTVDPAAAVAGMSKEELSKHFDADKADFYALDDPMKQCDRLEKQLNNIGRRDYEICLLQQQLNIYRQDFRLERMANLEARIQIEKLKNDIDRLCLERLQEETGQAVASDGEGEQNTNAKQRLHRGSSGRRSSSGVRFSEPVAAAADAVMSKFGHQLTKKAARSAAKAAKYAAKQAHREERKVAAAAAAAAASAQAQAQASAAAGSQAEPNADYHQHHRRHHRRGIRSEVVSDLFSTANKAMLTGYKMASTQVNLALDKLSQMEQQQAEALAQRQRQQQQQQQHRSSSEASAPLPSLD